MFDSLHKGLSGLIRKLTTGTVDRKAVEEILLDLKKLLLQSDVDVKLADELVEKIRKKTLEEKIPAGMTLREHVIKTIYNELVVLLGGKPESLLGKKRIMLVGLFGSGKTTTAGKLAKYFSKQGLRPALVTADFHRPAALEQLAQIGKQINVPVFYEKDPYTSVKKGLEKFAKYDTIIFDTAGRNALDAQLADELKKLKELIKPDELLLVIPADLGKVARIQAEEFHKLAGVTGVIITKMDGTAKAGGALAATSVTNAKVKFIGVGEKLEALELYDPQRFVSRLLGLGDLETLLEKAKEAEIKPETAEKMLEGKFSLNDFLEQIDAMQKMGPLKQVIQMIPGLGGAVPEALMEKQEEKMKIYKYIMQSMTKAEKENPDLIKETRIKRIAKGSGRQESEVRDLLEQYEKMKKMMKMLGGKAGMQRGMMRNFGKQFGFKF
jgi:signal recognition particle subunit SRP54